MLKLPKEPGGEEKFEPLGPPIRHEPVPETFDERTSNPRIVRRPDGTLATAIPENEEANLRYANPCLNDGIPY